MFNDVMNKMKEQPNTCMFFFYNDYLTINKSTILRSCHV